MEVAHRTDTGVEVKFLAQSDVDGTDAAADGGGQRSFDGDEAAGNFFNGLIGEPDLFIVDGVGFFSGIDLLPGDV